MNNTRRAEIFTVFIILCGAGFVLTLIWDFAGWKLTWFDAASFILVLATAGTEYFTKKQLKEWERELRDFDDFLTLVRYRFNTYEMIDEAVCDALDECRSKKIRKSMEKLYEVLKTEDNGESASAYRGQEKNPFFGLFLTLCLTVMEFGDKKDGEYSAFLTNIRYLRDEINSEINEIALKRYSFTGTVRIAVIPLLTLRLIEDWGVSNVEGLGDFYYGNTGDIIRLVILVLSGISVILISELKRHRFYEKGMGVLFTVRPPQKIRSCLARYFEKHANRTEKISLLLEECAVRTDYMTFFIFRQILCVACFILGMVFSVAYSSDGFSIPEMTVVLLVSCVSYEFPVLLLYYRRALLKSEVENEAFKFQSVIMILMYSEQISVYRILEEIEAFAVHYKRALGRAVNNFQRGDIETLEALHEESGCELMKRIVESLSQCTEIGVRASFSEIIPERNYYVEQRKQKNRISNEQKVLLAKVIAFVPLITVIGGYLIIPFVLESMKTMGNLNI